MPKRINLVVMPFLLTVLFGGAVAPALAQESIPNGTVDFINFLPAALMLFLPLGLILLISSAMPEEEAPITAVNLLITWSVAALAYFLVGFAFQFGGIAQVSPRSDLTGLYWEWYPLDQSVDADVARLWGVVALRGWALSGEASTPGALHLFLSHLSLVGVSAMIPAAVIPRRFGRTVILLMGVLSGTVLYPVVGNWLWGGGWLASLGLSLGLGHGLVDFGGASVIFLTGSVVAFTALLLFKSSLAAQDDHTEPAEVVVVTGLEHHLAVYDEPEDTIEEILPVTPMPAAYLPILNMLGGGLLLLGWFGLTTGIQSPTALNFDPAHAAVAGLLAALSAALAAAGYSWFTTSELNPLMIARGLTAGLIVAMAGAPFLPIWLIVVAGLLMGLLLPPLIYLFDQDLRFADGSGILATYGISAVVSLLLVPFFAGGQAGQGWNGVGIDNYLGVPDQGVSGLVVASGFVPDWPGQLQAQLLGMGAVILWALVISFLLFQTVKVVAAIWTRTGLEWADSPVHEAITSPASAVDSSPVAEAESVEDKFSEAAGENLTRS